MSGDAREEFGGARRILGEGVGEAGFLSAIFGGVGEEAHIGIGAEERGENRIGRLREKRVLRTLRNRSVRVFGENCQAFGAIFGREGQAACAESQLLLRADVTGAEGFTQLGANGRNPRVMMGPRVWWAARPAARQEWRAPGRLAIALRSARAPRPDSDGSQMQQQLSRWRALLLR
jgi:hypothetical protein